MQTKKAVVSIQPSFFCLNISMANLVNACWNGEEIDERTLDFSLYLPWSFPGVYNTSEQYSATALKFVC